MKARRAQKRPLFAFCFFCSVVSPSKEFQEDFLVMAMRYSIPYSAPYSARYPTARSDGK